MALTLMPRRSVWCLLFLNSSNFDPQLGHTPADAHMRDNVDVVEVDYAQWDVGKKTDSEPGLAKSSSAFSANRRKKMSVVEAITRRLPNKERIKSQRGRALSKDFSMALLDAAAPKVGVCRCLAKVTPASSLHSHPLRTLAARPWASFRHPRSIARRSCLSRTFSRTARSSTPTRSSCRALSKT